MSKKHKLQSALVGLAVILGEAAMAMAARKPEVAPELEDSIGWRPVLYMLVGIALVCVVAFRNARRTHLD